MKIVKMNVDKDRDMIHVGVFGLSFSVKGQVDEWHEGKEIIWNK